MQCHSSCAPPSAAASLVLFRSWASERILHKIEEPLQSRLMLYLPTSQWEAFFVKVFCALPPMLLPLPFLKVGYLTVPPVENPVAPHCDWKRIHFVLNHEALQQIHDDEQKHMARGISPISGDKTTNSKPAFRVDIPDVVSVTACSDLTLPPGPSIFIDTIHGPIYLSLRWKESKYKNPEMILLTWLFQDEVLFQGLASNFSDIVLRKENHHIAMGWCMSWFSTTG